MNQIFAWIYEKVFSIDSPEFTPILDILYDQDGYVIVGIALIFIPFVIWSVFYFLIQYPYLSNLHWRICFATQILITFVLSWFIVYKFVIDTDANTPLLYPSNEEYGQAIRSFARIVSRKIAFSNILLSAFFGYIWVLVLRRWSKQNIHLPKKYI